MRSIIVACALLLIGGAVAEAQAFYPPPLGYGFARPPHPHWHCKTRFDWHGPKKVCRWGW